MHGHHMIMAVILHDASVPSSVIMPFGLACTVAVKNAWSAAVVACMKALSACSALLMRSFSLPPEISKLPFNVEPTNESLQFLIIQTLTGILNKVGHEAEHTKQKRLSTEMAADIYMV